MNFHLDKESDTSLVAVDKAQISLISFSFSMVMYPEDTSSQVRLLFIRIGSTSSKLKFKKISIMKLCKRHIIHDIPP